MRYIILLFLLSFTLSAKSTDSCYTLQLFSHFNPNEVPLTKPIPSSCIAMQIGKQTTVRCGCYDSIKEARDNLVNFKDSYKKVYIATTYRYRFEKEEVKIISVTPIIPILKDISDKNETIPQEVIQESSENVIWEPMEDTNESLSQEANNSLPQEIIEEEYSISDNLEIKQSYLFRGLSNKSEYQNSPYLFALTEAKFLGDSYEVEAGLLIYKDSNDSGTAINQLSYGYFGESFEFKIGSYINTLGVLDYMSSINITNPSRVEFFDDENINIRKIPLMMADITYYVNDSLTFKTVLQPFDEKYQNYTSRYLSVVLDAYLPNYLDSLGGSSADAKAVIDEIFIPAYGDGISPELNAHIQSKYDISQSSDIDKASIFLISEYLGDESKYGAVWINRYSEIPLIGINEEVLKIVKNIDDPQEISTAIEEYVEQENLDPITDVEGYRYNQYSMYYEGTADSYGIRLEASYRDKLPTINEYSWLSSLGFGVDHSSQSVYSNLELQWLHLDSYNEDVYAGILTTKFNSVEFDSFDIYFSHYLVFGYYNGIYEVATYPNIVSTYENFSLTLQYIASKEQSELNSASFILKAVF